MAEHYPTLLFLVQFLNIAGTSTFFIFYFLFPNGPFVPRWLGWVVPIAILHGLIWAFRPDLLNNNDWTSYPAFVIAIVAIIYRYRRVSNTFQRQQTKWVVFGSTVGIAGALGLNAFVSIVNPTGVPNVVNDLIGLTAWLLCLLLIPASIGVAILRSHLWDIDILIRRTLIYGALTALLALVYLGAVIALQAILTAVTGAQRSELVTVLSTLVIAALFVPLRNRIQAVIDRRSYRRKYDAARTLAKFGSNLRDDTTADLNLLTEHLLDVVDESMQPETAALWLVKRSFEGRGGPSLALGEWMPVEQSKNNHL